MICLPCKSNIVTVVFEAHSAIFEIVILLLAGFGDIDILETEFMVSTPEASYIFDTPP